MVAEGRSVMHLPLLQRKGLLQQALATAGKTSVLYQGELPAKAELLDQRVAGAPRRLLGSRRRVVRSPSPLELRDSSPSTFIRSTGPERGSTCGERSRRAVFLRGCDTDLAVAADGIAKFVAKPWHCVLSACALGPRNSY